MYLQRSKVDFAHALHHPSSPVIRNFKWFYKLFSFFYSFFFLRWKYCLLDIRFHPLARKKHFATAATILVTSSCFTNFLDDERIIKNLGERTEQVLRSIPGGHQKSMAGQMSSLELINSVSVGWTFAICAFWKRRLTRPNIFKTHTNLSNAS